MLLGSDPFLVYPQQQAWTCPQSTCLDLPEAPKVHPLALTSTHLDSLRFYPRQGARPSWTPPPPEAKDSSNLKLTGSKTIRTSLSQGGMLVQQEMVLDVKGEPTPGLAVEAHLTDMDAPLSSSGSTTTLRQTDEIWIDARTKRFHSRIGDQSISPPAGLLGTDSRNGRGISLEVGDPQTVQGKGSLAAGRSLWLRTELSGISGIQEGYAVTGTGTLRGIVPGSEKVWLDGLLLQRNTDYELRNADGILDFTPSRRILSSSKITVEYQAANQDYERTITQGGARGRLGDWTLDAWVLREADDPTSALTYVADSTTRRLLAQAGADSALATTGSGTRVPLPSSQLRTALAARWNGPIKLETEARWTRMDRNLVSALDPQREGGAFAATAEGQTGSFLTQGGLGRWSLSGKYTGWQNGYQALRPIQPDTQQTEGWTAPVRTASSLDQEALTLDWKAIPDLGARIDVGHFRREDWGDVSSGAMTLGLDRDSLNQLLFQQTLASLDQGRRFQRSSSRLAVGWKIQRWEPRMQAQFGQREDPTSQGSNLMRWQEASAGLTYRETHWSTGPRLRLRTDGSEFSTDRIVDSSRSIEATWLGEVQTPQWNGSFHLDWLREETRTLPTEVLEPRTHWLAEMRSQWLPLSNGIRLEGHYRLSTSQWRPSLPIYDTVPTGTGKYRYDSSNGEVIADEFGNLILTGTRLDSLHPAKQSGNILFTVSGSLVPKDAFPSLSGLLADLGEQFQLELEQVDSNQSKIFPDWNDRFLSNSILGRSSLSNRFWWERGHHRIELHSDRSFRSSIQNWSYSKDQDVSWKQEITLTKQVNQSLKVNVNTGFAERRHKWSESNDAFERKWIEPSCNMKWHSLDGEVATTFQSGSRTANQKSLVEMQLYSQSALIGWRPLLAIRLWTTLKHIDIQSGEDLGSWLTDGYPPGESWRLQSGMEWNTKESIQASADWILRILPHQPMDQKISLQAKAIF